MDLADFSLMDEINKRKKIFQHIGIIRIFLKDHKRFPHINFFISIFIYY